MGVCVCVCVCVCVYPTPGHMLQYDTFSSYYGIIFLARV